MAVQSRIRTQRINAFTDLPFGGNPAVVCVTDVALDGALMQAIATEMNVSETAFLVPLSDHQFSLRWFTPETEVDLCGHATLAAAHALWSDATCDRSREIRFETRSGTLATRSAGEWITMDFPAEPVVECNLPDKIELAIGAEITFFGRNRMDYLAVLKSEEAVRSLTPDIETLKSAGGRGFIVTAQADAESDCDFISRFFAPNAGVPEDPVTGSAHCALGPFWGRALNKHRLTGYQASSRGGWVYLAVRGNRVALSGKAVTVLSGELMIPQAKRLSS